MLSENETESKQKSQKKQGPVSLLICFQIDTQYKKLKYPIQNLKYPIKPKRGGYIPNCLQSLSGAMYNASVILLPFWGYSLCLLNLGINPNLNPQVGKNLQNWEDKGIYQIWKQPVFGCKIGIIKSLCPATWHFI